MIEDILKELIIALNANTAAVLKNGAKLAKKITESSVVEAALISTAEEKKEEAAPVASVIDLSALTSIAQEILDKGGLDKIKEANAKFGIKKVSACPPEKFDELHKLFTGIKEELSAA